ncbi:hypothetical protein GQ53DRAFT_751213 [Thozetella sp. PMI_491]|nr:hypothetical protein GQ53DRAFT_751213 [Thozetella sp. PMI_491]
MCSADIFLGLLALLFPPLPVWVKCGICSADSIINILLCMLGFIPGLIHSWYIIAKYPEPSYDYEGPTDNEDGHVYVFVHDGRSRPQRASQPPAQPRPQGYGTTNNQAPSAGPAPQAGPGPSEAAGPSDGLPPPSYAQVVAGDNKVQSQD